MDKSEKSTESNTRWKNPHGNGTIYVRKGWLWMSIGNVRETTGIRWVETGKSEQRAALDAAMKKLKERSRRHEGTGANVVQPRPAMTLYGAIADFKKTRFDGFSRSIQSRYRMAFRHFLADAKHGDMILDFHTLKERIVTKKKACELSSNTCQKVLYKLTIFLDYCVQSGWLDRNPMSVIGIDKTHRDDDDDIDAEVAIFTDDEVKAILKWLLDNGYPRQAEYVEMLYLTAMRPSEALKMKWEHWQGVTFKIFGKRTRGNPSGIRYLPLRDEHGVEVRPGLLNLLERLQRHSDLYDGYVFPWRTVSAIQKLFRTYRKPLGMANGRTLKTLRPTANLVFRDTLRWSLEFRCEYLGHSIAVNMQHYNRKRTPDQIVQFASIRSVTKES